MTVDRIEAARVLGVAAAFDNRTPSEIAARAWAESLPDIGEADAKAIIPAHYRETNVWIMPSDILRRVKELRRRRVQDMATPIPPEAIAADDTGRERAWLRSYVEAIGAGHEPPEADRLACLAVRVTRRDQIASARPVKQLVAQVAADGQATERRMAREHDAVKTAARAETAARTEGASA